MSAIVTLVVAMSDNRVIGRGGGIPWRIPEDMRRFKALTTGHPIVMGRKTWDSLPRKPLPGRTNVVVTRDSAWRADGAAIAHTLAAAFALANTESPTEIAIIGGAEIYRAALPFVQRIHLTEVHAVVDGDVVMPEFDAADWTEIGREAHPPSGTGGPAFSFVTLERRGRLR